MNGEDIFSIKRQTQRDDSNAFGTRMGENYDTGFGALNEKFKQMYAVESGNLYE
ncbi:hypothetical protein KIN20_031905 [Parelaphostrongylus tenuis]|uniref:Uncharacterized protein n=1 Tax=Parelaphostrongylus tenuis TaxID=148309 RepID=A0AAD5R641_PARTN|nr:hypothetical protein KIN20_031905 [Parelaphostrongylus tenuis]